MSSTNENNSTSQVSALDNIKHVIVLMFENRSFDHILGAMPGVNGVLDGTGNVNQELYNTLNPLAEKSHENPATHLTEIAPGTQSDPPPYSEQDYMKHGFNHSFVGMVQDLYGPGTTGVIKGEPQNNPKTTYPSTNSGFVKANEEHEKDSKVMSYFKWNSMQVFHRLAENYVVCDNWYCDMPDHTKPNRAFMHCATTGDLGIDNNDAGSHTHMVNQPTIFETIEKFY
ncbi:MAG: alkaline phosphatase family protein, partial [Blastocatellia bacterium]